MFSRFSYAVGAPLPEGQEEQVKLCHSTQEYIQALEFLRSHGTAGMRDEVARGLADQVSRGCDGAAERFRQTYLMLAKMGVNHIKALEIAMEFSQLSSEVQENFLKFFNTPISRSSSITTLRWPSRSPMSSPKN